MRAKVFGIILTSFILVMAVNGTAKVLGQEFKKNATTSMFEQVRDSDEYKNMLGSNDILEMSTTELHQLMSSHEISEKLRAGSQVIDQQSKRYSVISFVVQILLIAGIALLASKLTINTVKRNV